MQKVSLTLTENNAKKLLGGYPIQLSKDQLSGNKHYLVLHPSTHARVVKAKAAGKGVRVKLTQPELEASGEGFMDILRGIKKGAMWAKQHIIDTPIYQSAVKPVVRKLVDSAVAAATPAISSIPLIGPAAAPLVKQGVDKLGQVTNAYGLVMEQPEVAVMSKNKPKNKAKSKSKSKPKPKPKGRLDSAKAESAGLVPNPALGTKLPGTAKAVPIAGSFLIN